MDPQHRFILEQVSETMQAMAGKVYADSFGVYVGIAGTEYGVSALEYTGPTVSVYSATGSQLSVAAGRLSYVFGLKGPSVSIDTACSSSLVSTHLGYGSLRQGECSDAIVCGVNMTLSAFTTAMFKRAGMLAEDGRCKVLDSSADGYVRSESCGTLLLRSGDGSSREGGVDSHSVICSTSVNQDGRSSSLTAPNGPSQQGVIGSALRDAGVSASSICDLQMHGTGTSLGDPIEVGAAGAVLLGSRSQPLSLSAVKATVGHSEPAAGIAGVMQSVASLSFRSSIGMRHLIHVNPHVAGALVHDLNRRHHHSR